MLTGTDLAVELFGIVPGDEPAGGLMVHPSLRGANGYWTILDWTSIVFCLEIEGDKMLEGVYLKAAANLIADNLVPGDSDKS